MGNSNKGVPHRIRKGVISFRIVLSIVSKVSWTHNNIITLFDKPWFAWYKVWYGEKNSFIVICLVRGKIFDAS